MVPETTAAARIRQLNDAFRQSFSGGRVLLTSGIRAFPEADIAVITDRVKAFAAFSEENDPHVEHDFGSFRYKGQLIYWKIDYYIGRSTTTIWPRCGAAPTRPILK